MSDGTTHPGATNKLGLRMALLEQSSGLHAMRFQGEKVAPGP